MRRIRSLPWPFFVWLAVFYAGWALIVFGGGRWDVVADHWPIAAAMAAGSYVAGSTPMGGGTVGFPILVLLFDQPATIGRNFSFAVQSVGMVSASIFILSLRRRLAWRMLGWSLLGSAIGTPLGAMLLAPHVPGLVVKLLFAVVWASFGVMTLLKVKEIARFADLTRASAAFDRNVGLCVGFFGGGCVASLTGVGVDMILYAVLVLLLRADLKIAVPTSVVLMAFTSLVGLATNKALGTIEPEVWNNWLAAAPVVALGAPLGVFIVNFISRTPTLIFVSILCLGQFLWTCVNENVRWPIFLLAIGGVLVCNVCFHLMYMRGFGLALRSPPGPTPGAPE